MIATLGFWVACLAATMVASPGAAYRFGVLSLTDAFLLLRWGVYAALAAVVIASIGGFAARWGGDKRGFMLALFGIVIGAAAFWIPYSQLRQAQSVPPIHDISTDTENPPKFEALLPVRLIAPNGHEYGGFEVARQQRTAYPDIQSIPFAGSPTAAFNAALAAATTLEIAAASSETGRIEATDTTWWWGFKDDVVIRVTAVNGDSLIDVRSVSRVGRSDLGKNAARIRRFSKAIGPP